MYSIIESEKDLERAYKYILSEFNSITIFDVDQTIRDDDRKLVNIFRRLRRDVKNEIAEEAGSFIYSGRPVYCRLHNTKKDSANIAKEVDLLCGQGGAVMYNSLTDEWYITPLKQDVRRIIKIIAEETGISRTEVFRGGYLAINLWRRGKEEVTIPIAKEDEEEVKEILSNYTSIVEAFEYNALPYEYGLAIGEYLERGMPERLITVLYESDINQTEVTELTAVAEGEAMKRIQVALDKIGIKVGIQDVGDRTKNTRGAKDGNRPKIADITRFGKADHIKVMAKHIPFSFGFGNAENDDFLFVTGIAGVVNPTKAGEGKEEDWKFAIEMAKYAQKCAEEEKDIDPYEREHYVVHIKNKDDGKYGNAVVCEYLSKATVKERKQFLVELANSEENLKMRAWLLDGAKPNTSPKDYEPAVA